MRALLIGVLGCSAIVNAVLLVGDPLGSAPSQQAAGDSRGNAAGAHPAGVRSEVAGGLARSEPLTPQVWTSLESTDLATLRDRLRAAGFPETVVHALVGHRIGAAFEARRLERYGPATLEPFWKTRDPQEQRDRRAFDRQLAREQRALSRELLGDGSLGGEARFYLNERYGSLPPQKAQILQSIESDYGEMSYDVRGDGFGSMLQEDREKLQMLEREKQADIAAALSPEEYERYQLQYSQTANAVRNRLRYFEPSEEEFLAVYALQKVFDERYPSSAFAGPRSQDEMRARSAAESELKAQIKTVLGDERHAAYERAASSSYRAAVKIAEHFKLPPENAGAVHELEVKYNQLRTDVMTTTKVPAEREAAMRALAAEAGAQVDALLTAEGGKVYRENGGHWLRSLERPVQSRPAPGP